METRRLRVGIVLVATTLFATSASAWEPKLPKLSFRGFGTLGAVYSTADDADFVGNLFQPKGAGDYRRVDFGVDSKLGLQVDAQFGEKLSAVVQVVSQHRYDDTYWPELEWANLKYEFTPELSVRIGRTVASPFMVSESRLVGFSYPWIRPPLEVYGMAPVTNRDGIDATYQLRHGAWTHSLHAAYGLTSLKLPGGGRADAGHFLEVNDTVSRGAFTFRFGYTFAVLDLHSPGVETLFNGLSDFGNGLSGIPGLDAVGRDALDVHDKFEVRGSPVSLFAIGATWDPGTWLVMAEVAREDNYGFLADITAWYVTCGYRFGAFTPYVTVAQLIGDEASGKRITTAGLPSPLAEAAVSLNDGIDQGIQISAASQTSVSAGVRWDVRKNIALKLQYDHVDLGSGSAGRLGNVQPDFEPGGTVDAVSFTLDFVF